MIHTFRLTDYQIKVIYPYLVSKRTELNNLLENLSSVIPPPKYLLPAVRDELASINSIISKFRSFVPSVDSMLGVDGEL